MKFLCLALFFSTAALAAETPLAQQLQAKTKASNGDPKSKKVMESALEKLRKSRLSERAVKKGANFPDFVLPGLGGKTFDSKELRKEGAMVITFYRGSWCPYCNIQLAEYQKHLEEWKTMGAQLLAISPEMPESTTGFAAKRNLTFPLLFDKDNQFAEKLGLVYGVAGDLKEVYRKFGVDLEKSQGNDNWRLPIAATYVVGRDGKVIYSFLDVDYKKRSEPGEITEALKKIIP